MPAPANRAKIRLVRGNYSNIAANIAELVDGELCYARDQNKLYIVNDNTLTAVSTDAAGGIDSATLTETIQDVIGDSLIAGSNVTIQYNDVTGRTTINSTASSAGGGSGGATSLDELSDVQISSVLNGQLLRYDSSSGQWRNITPNYLTSISASNLNAISINALSDVDTNTASPQSGNVLAWNGANWSPSAINVSQDITDLGDVDITSPANAQLLTYDSELQKWINSNPPTVNETDTLDSVTSRGAVTTNNISVGKAFFKNTFSAIGDLPTASTNNGLFVHVAATGKAYYASAGNWIEILSGTQSLDSLSDVQITSTPSNNNILAYDSSNGQWRPASLPVDALSDVDTSTTAPTANKILKFNGTNWVPGEISIDNLSDVNTTSAAASNGDVLTYNASTNQWVPAAPTGGGGGSSVVLIPDAPSDGNHYLRINESWVTLQAALSSLGIDAGVAGEAGTEPAPVNNSTSGTVGSSGEAGTYIAEAPDDGFFYVRKNATWVTLQAALAEITIDAGQAYYASF